MKKERDFDQRHLMFAFNESRPSSILHLHRLTLPHPSSKSYLKLRKESVHVECSTLARLKQS